MRCPDCKKQVDMKMEHCPYCGAALPQERQEVDRRENTPLNIQSIVKENGIRIAVASVLTLVCFFLWRIIIANAQATVFGELTKEAFNQTVSTMRGRIILFAVCGFIGYFLYLLLMKRIQKQLIFCIITVALCVVGLLIFYPVTHMTVNDEKSQYVLLYSRSLMFLYGFGIPMLQGALSLSLLRRKNTIKQLIYTLVAFAVGAIIGALFGNRMIMMGHTTAAFGLIYALLSSIVALAVSMLLDWRDA